MPASLVMFTRGDLGGMSLTNDTARAYGSAADALWKAVRDKDTLSKASVGAALQTTILQACDAAHANAATPFEQRLSEANRILKTCLTSEPLQWDVHIPVRGLDPAGLAARLGAVRFRTATPAVIRAWRKRSLSP